jgi:TetR/AcrR family tetracycline transcriptional repressor
LDEDGFDQMSLRRLASYIGMHAPGLYWYVENKQDLIDLMAHELLAQGLSSVALPKNGQSWDEWMVELGITLRRALLARRDGARLVASAYLMRTQAVTPVIEMAIEVLEEVGFDSTTALGCVMTLIRFTVGAALDEQISPIHMPNDAAEAQALAARRRELIDPAKWPRTAAAMERTLEKDTGVRNRDTMFRWAAQMVVRGMADLRRG